MKTWEPRPESSALRHSSTWDARGRQKLEEMWEDSDGDALHVLDLRPPELLTLPGSRGCLQSELKMNTRGLGAQLKDSIPVTEPSASGPLESHDLRKGFSCVKNELLPSHPLELSENNVQLSQDKMNFSTLRNIRGLFAPLKLQMEFKAVQQAQRLPFLPSSHLSLDILRGDDETVGFEDILHDPSQSELMGEPHLMVEYKRGLL
ncbi:proteasome maturation protein-like [Eptesicus fuscus]|uniref:proteasome maturation protein-like n=1 Tax=Eptesicus fuscus TaxID=29078 RepID=UPI002404532F|nr:proteasome maturation protein-like [Eptesicus fuscus]